MSYDKIIIASVGRAGSTMLFKEIRDAYVRTLKFPIPKLMLPIFGRFVCRLETQSFLPKIIKTHDLNCEIRSTWLYIFIHTDMLTSAISVYNRTQTDGIQWFESHQHNLKGHGEFNDLFVKDVLNYRQQMKFWIEASKIHENVISISLRDLPSKIRELSELIGFEFYIPELDYARIEKKFDDKIKLKFDPAVFND